VAETDASDIEDGVRESRREHADSDPDLASSRHDDILPERGGTVVEC
jgi:hypothetical protein